MYSTHIFKAVCGTCYYMLPTKFLWKHFYHSRKNARYHTVGAETCMTLTANYFQLQKEKKKGR